jgi:hypothetical protein
LCNGLKIIENVESAKILNSVVTLVSAVPEIDKQQTFAIKLGGSRAPENIDLVRRLSFQNSLQTMSDNDSG